MLKITKDSHLDHSLTLAHIQFILKEFGEKDEFFIVTLEMPDDLPNLPCALYGPAMGDLPVKECDIVYKTREGRKGASRMVDKPSRPSKCISIIAGPHGDDKCILYTAFGGPITPKETFDDPSQESKDFWSKHALSIN